MKKIFFSTFIFLVVFGTATLIRLQFAKAANVPGDVSGFAWGGTGNGGSPEIPTGIGAVSLSSADPGMGGGATYAVNVPDASCIGVACAVTGFAYAENAGYIDFNPQDHCTEGIADATHYKAKSCNVPVPVSGGMYSNWGAGSGTGGVFRIGNENVLIGWARFVETAIATAVENADGTVGNAGGNDGWIGIFSETDLDATLQKYYVKIGADGNMTGFGFSDGGSIQFIGKAVAVPAVSLALDVPLPRVYLNSGEDISTTKATLTWKINTGNIASCTKSCEKSDGTSLSCPDWETAVVTSVAAPSTQTVSSITLPAPYVKFIFKCIDTIGVVSNSASQIVEVGCANKQCSNQACGFGTFVRTGFGNTCPDSANTCTTDSDCPIKSIGTWKEVAP